MENQQAWEEMTIKELKLCIDRCNKAMKQFDLSHKVLPLYGGRQEADTQLMAAVRGISNTKKIAQEQLEKIQQDALDRQS